MKLYAHGANSPINVENHIALKRTCLGEMGSDPNAYGQQLAQGIESHRWHADGVRVENFPRIHYVGHPRRNSKTVGKSVNLSISTTESSSCQCKMIMNGVKTETQSVQNFMKFSKCARRFLWCRWSFMGTGSEKTWYGWYGTYSEKPDGNWDRTAEMKVFQFNSESGPQHSCPMSLKETRI